MRSGRNLEKASRSEDSKVPTIARTGPLCLGLAVCSLAAASNAIAAPRLPIRADNDLYSDAIIKKLIEDGGKEEATKGVWLLDVVTPGETRPRQEMFVALGLAETRMRERRETPVDHVVYLRWQVSPSFDLECMTVAKGRADETRDKFDRERPVYGVRIISRAAGIGR
jgi:hypothetical protein